MATVAAILSTLGSIMSQGQRLVMEEEWRGRGRGRSSFSGTALPVVGSLVAGLEVRECEEPRNALQNESICGLSTLKVQRH